MFGSNHFGVSDYIAVALTLLFSIVIGLYYGLVGKQTKEEILVGGRNMKSWPIAISMLVTYFSATAILGSPAEVYSYGTQFYFLIILACICVPLSSLVFVKVFYEMELTSIYEYLEYRFKSQWVRWLTSFTFILQILLINAITLFAPAIALQAILGLPIWLSVTGIGLIGTVYTSVGGLKAVVWTDVFQFVMIMIGMGAIVIKGFMKAGGIVEAFEKAGEKGRLQLFDFSVDPFMRHNTLNFILGHGFTMFALYGTHQPLVQRYCSLPSAAIAFKTLILTIPLTVFTYSATVLTGISAVATYSGCCPILLGKIQRPDAIIPHFVIEELAFLPGMMGIFVSCIFSAVLSSVSSTLNSLAAVTWEDFLAKIPFFRDMKPTGQAHCTKIIAALYGVLSIFLAFGAQNLGTLFQIVMTAVGATSGPLGGIFLCGLFIPFMNRNGAVLGILCGLGSMMFLAVQSFVLNTKYILNPRLPTDLDECPLDTDFSTAINYTSPVVPDLEYPEKLYSLSYLLYSFCGASITVTIGVVISLLSGGLSNKVEKKYLHPWIREVGWVQRFIQKEYPKSRVSYKQSGKSIDSSEYPYKYNELVGMGKDAVDNNNGKFIVQNGKSYLDDIGKDDIGKDKDKLGTYYC